MNASPPTDGLRVFTCGHSFHWFVADMLGAMAAAAGIAQHRKMGVSAIGGSRAIQHWDVPYQRNHAQAALRRGEVDVLTLSCMTYPDDGIAKFAALAAACNPKVRVTLQALWLPEDRFPFDPTNRTRSHVAQFNRTTGAQLHAQHDAYYRVMEDHVAQLNARLGGPVVHLVPDGRATVALRERIIVGLAPGLSQQSDLFTDAWGHAAVPLRWLTAYCHFAVVYRRSPVGLATPPELADAVPHADALNAMLQRLAWDAATSHPQSGVSRTAVA